MNKQILILGVALLICNPLFSQFVEVKSIVNNGDTLVIDSARKHELNLILQNDFLLPYSNISIAGTGKYQFDAQSKSFVVKRILSRVVDSLIVVQLQKVMSITEIKDSSVVLIYFIGFDFPISQIIDVPLVPLGGSSTSVTCSLDKVDFERKDFEERVWKHGFHKYKNHFFPVWIEYRGDYKIMHNGSYYHIGNDPYGRKKEPKNYFYINGVVSAINKVSMDTSIIVGTEYGFDGTITITGYMLVKSQLDTCFKIQSYHNSISYEHQNVNKLSNSGYRYVKYTKDKMTYSVSFNSASTWNTVPLVVTIDKCGYAVGLLEKNAQIYWVMSEDEDLKSFGYVEIETEYDYPVYIGGWME